MTRRTYQLAATIGKRLRDARLHLGWSQRELAERALVGRNAVDRIERGEVRNPGVGTLYDLARAMGVKVEWLICGVGEGPG